MIAERCHHSCQPSLPRAPADDARRPLGGRRVRVRVPQGGRRAEQSPAAPLAVQVGAENVTVVTTQDISTGPLISGTLMADKDATVRAEVTGSILQVTAAEGQQVRRGALLARIEDQALGDAYKSAQSAVRSAEQALGVAEREAHADREPGQGRRARRAGARHGAQRRDRRAGPARGCAVAARLRRQTARPTSPFALRSTAWSPPVP